MSRNDHDHSLWGRRAVCLALGCALLSCGAPPPTTGDAGSRAPGGGASCTDGVQNGDETGRDCGGSCRACPAGQAERCGDGMKDGAETDIDCGGSCAARCGDGRACIGGSDCQTGLCLAGRCLPAACGNGAHDGGETDVDCGGPACGRCAVGRRCLADSDCAGARCVAAQCGGLVLSAVQPAEGPVTGGTVLTLSGLDLPAGGVASVTIGGVAASQVQIVSSVQIRVTTGARPAPGKVDVTLAIGGAAVTLAGAFEYYPVPVFQHTQYATSLDTKWVAVGDMNGDGKLDVVTAHENTVVNVLLGDGAGGLGAPRVFSGGRNISSLVLVDVNGDNRLDVATTDLTDLTTSVFLGNGDGTLQARQVYASSAINGISAADLNEDGRPDLVAAVGNGSTDVAVLLNAGGGTFGAAARIASGCTGTRATAIGDVNLDGHSDVAVACVGSSQVGVLLGAGDGRFQAPRVLDVGASTRSVVIADLSGDGKPDLATANGGGNSVSVLLGDGAGGFAGRKDYAVGAEPLSVRAGDMNGDGRPDLIVANTNTAADISATTYYMGVLLGSADGTFKPQMLWQTGKRPWALAIGDLNSDGRPDVLCANIVSDTVSVFLRK